MSRTHYDDGRWDPPQVDRAACGARVKSQARISGDPELTTCPRCKRTKAYKQALRAMEAA